MSQPTLSDSALRDGVGVWRFVIVAITAVLALFLVLPLIVIIPASFTAGEFLETFPKTLSLRWYDEIFSDPTWRAAFGLSAKLSIVDAVLATILGTCAALAVGRVKRARRWLRTAFLAPLILPEIVYALGIYNLIYGLDLTPSSWFIVPGQTCLAFPLVFIAVSSGLARIDPTVVQAAQSLGASWTAIVWQIELPLLVRHIAAAATFALAFCFDNVVMALFLATPGSSTLPVQIYSTAESEVSPAIASAGVVVMVVALAMVSLVPLIMRTRRSSGGRAR
jgi:putative spermidine/putrescine transport system permease protein